MNLKLMTTDEKNRNKTDRNIPMKLPDLLYEILGNLSGNIQCFFYHNGNIYIWHNDDGFSRDDKDAIITKNKSGSSKDNCSVNGHGIKLTIDRLIKDNACYKQDLACFYSFGENREKIYLGNFNHTSWMDVTIEDMTYYESTVKKMSGNTTDTLVNGTLLVIPLNDKWLNVFNNEEKKIEIRKHIHRFMNLKIYNEWIDFYYNGRKTQLDTCLSSLTDDDMTKKEGVFKAVLGYDTPNTDISSCSRKPIIMRIINHLELSSVFEDIPEYVKLPGKPETLTKNDLYTPYEMENRFLKINNTIVHIYYDIVDDSEAKDQATEYTNSESDLDGAFVYLNNHCINHRVICKNLGGKSKQGGAFGKKIFDGHPRINFFINKNNDLFELPVDKANIQATKNGERLLKVMGVLLKKEVNNRDTISPSTKLFIWHKAFHNSFSAACPCCKDQIYANWGKIQVEFGHIISDYNDGTNEWKNLLPICKECNRKMSNTHMLTWIRTIYPENFQDFKNLLLDYRGYIDDSSH